MALDEKELLTDNQALEKLRTLLEEFPIAFMVTVSNGAVTARSIGVVGDEAFKGSLWFITGEPGTSGNAGIARL